MRNAFLRVKGFPRYLEVRRAGDADGEDDQDHGLAAETETADHADRRAAADEGERLRAAAGARGVDIARDQEMGGGTVTVSNYYF